MLKKIVIVVIAAILIGTPAMAGSYSLKIINNALNDVTRVSVKGGKVTGFSKILPGNSGTFTIVMPDGKCISSRMRVTFSAVGFADVINFNVCKRDTIGFTGGYNG